MDVKYSPRQRGERFAAVKATVSPGSVSVVTWFLEMREFKNCGFVMIIICVCRNWFVHIITLSHITSWWDWQIPFLCVKCLAIELQIPAWPATRGVPAGTPFFHIRRTLPWPEFHGIPPDCRQKSYKKAARAPWFQQCRTQANLGSFSFFYDLESEITLSKKQRFHRTFFNVRKGFYWVLFKVCGRIIFELKLILIKSNE